MIRIRDLEFASPAEAAAHFGVTARHVRNARQEGRLDSVGLGKGHLKGKTVTRRLDSYMPVVVRGQRFETAKRCADHFGIETCTVYTLVADGRADRIGLGSGCGAGGNRCMSITIGRVTYPSRKAASIALGLSPRYISNALCGRGHASMDRVVARAMALDAQQARERLERARLAAARQMRLDSEEAA